MQEIRLSQSEAVTYVILIHAVIGFVLGLIPLVIGIVKKKTKLGLLGLVVGVVAGALIGFLGSIPSMAIFTWLVLRKDIIAPEHDTEIASNDDDPQ